MTRYHAAAIIAALQAAFVFAFATQTHNAYDLPTYIDISEWPAVLLYLAAGWLAVRRREQLAALALICALLAFFAAEARFLFTTPLAFVLVTAGAVAFLTVLPVTWKPR